MNFKCAIFDADGTLLDSMKFWQGVAREYLLSLGKEPSDDLDKKVKDMSLYNAAIFLKDEYGVVDSPESIMDSINKIVEKYYKNKIIIKSGVAEFLEELKKKNIKMCIASATDEYLLSMALKRCGIREYFEKIYTCNSVGSGKDKPLIFRKPVNDFGIEKSQCIVFEDALYAIKTAKKDGFCVVGVYDDTEDENSKVRELSDFYLNNFIDMNEFWQFVESK